MEYRTIDVQELQYILRMIRGSKIIGLTTITEPKLKKGHPEGVVKISRINGVINCDYSNCVNNQREREGQSPDFIPEPRAWGTRLTNLPMVSHVTKDGDHRLYLEVKVQRVISTEYKQYGKVIPYEMIKPFLYDKKSNVEHQGLDKEVVWRDYLVKNIISIDLDGHGYIISHGV